ncbi:hypothetical protein KQI88_04350 [Alkaliphilus sp. MSJ-5]|uniref:Uncharacterized protein n=1 Tax=Alkaliphilus flagellatus TaxID=2841507 RepID=A0ABS6FZG2_9FIRM|nr:hypothetical protein [Alkaliphilus flagellatus]
MDRLLDSLDEKDLII